MHTFTITFQTENETAFNAAIDALSSVYGYSDTVHNPDWKIGSDLQERIQNPESKTDFLSRAIFSELTAKVAAFNANKAAKEAVDATAETAKLFVVL